MNTLTDGRYLCVGLIMKIFRRMCVKWFLNYMKVFFNPIAVYGGGYEYESDTDIYVYISYISIIILYSPQS